jgi:hypothetical protein
LKTRFAVAVLAACLGLNALATAATLKGTARNGTTGKPAAGDEVVLINLSEAGMDESARAQTDSAGRFSFTIADTQTPRLVRTIHQGVSYHKLAPAGATSVEVEVYDAATKLDGVTAIADVQRFQAEGETLQVIEQIAVRNASSPPRTLSRPFEIHLPPEAQIDSGMVQTGRGQPLKSMPLPGSEKGRYYFSSPLRPGDTRFQVVYRLSYKGVAVIEPKSLYPLERFVIVLPNSMKFEPKTAKNFQPGFSKTGDIVQVASAVKPGQPLTFQISGAGTLSEIQRTQPEKAQGGETAARPGGGLGAPIELPDPLQRDRWLILGGLALVLTAGAVFVGRRPAAAKNTSDVLARNGKPQRSQIRALATRENAVLRFRERNHRESALLQQRRILESPVGLDLRQRSRGR